MSNSQTFDSDDDEDAFGRNSRNDEETDNDNKVGNYLVESEHLLKIKQEIIEQCMSFINNEYSDVYDTINDNDFSEENCNLINKHLLEIKQEPSEECMSAANNENSDVFDTINDNDYSEENYNLINKHLLEIKQEPSEECTSAANIEYSDVYDNGYGENFKLEPPDIPEETSETENDCYDIKIVQCATVTWESEEVNSENATVNTQNDYDKNFELTQSNVPEDSLELENDFINIKIVSCETVKWDSEEPIDQNKTDYAVNKFNEYTGNNKAQTDAPNESIAEFSNQINFDDPCDLENCKIVIVDGVPFNDSEKLCDNFKSLLYLCEYDLEKPVYIAHRPDPADPSLKQFAVKLETRDDAFLISYRLRLRGFWAYLDIGYIVTKEFMGFASEPAVRYNIEHIENCNEQNALATSDLLKTINSLLSCADNNNLGTANEDNNQQTEIRSDFFSSFNVVCNDIANGIHNYCKLNSEKTQETEHFTHTVKDKHTNKKKRKKRNCKYDYYRMDDIFLLQPYSNERIEKVRKSFNIWLSYSYGHPESESIVNKKQYYVLHLRKWTLKPFRPSLVRVIRSYGYKTFINPFILTSYFIRNDRFILIPFSELLVEVATHEDAVNICNKLKMHGYDAETDEGSAQVLWNKYVLERAKNTEIKITDSCSNNGISDDESPELNESDLISDLRIIYLWNWSRGLLDLHKEIANSGYDVRNKELNIRRYANTSGSTDNTKEFFVKVETHTDALKIINYFASRQLFARLDVDHIATKNNIFDDEDCQYISTNYVDNDATTRTENNLLSLAPIVKTEDGKRIPIKCMVYCGVESKLETHSNNSINRINKTKCPNPTNSTEEPCTKSNLTADLKIPNSFKINDEINAVVLKSQSGLTSLPVDTNNSTYCHPNNTPSLSESHQSIEEFAVHSSLEGHVSNSTNCKANDTSISSKQNCNLEPVLDMQSDSNDSKNSSNCHINNKTTSSNQNKHLTRKLPVVIKIRRSNISNKCKVGEIVTSLNQNDSATPKSAVKMNVAADSINASKSDLNGFDNQTFDLVTVGNSDMTPKMDEKTVKGLSNKTCTAATDKVVYRKYRKLNIKRIKALPQSLPMASIGIKKIFPIDSKKVNESNFDSEILPLKSNCNPSLHSCIDATLTANHLTECKVDDEKLANKSNVNDERLFIKPNSHLILKSCVDIVAANNASNCKFHDDITTNKSHSDNESLLLKPNCSSSIESSIDSMLTASNTTNSNVNNDASPKKCNLDSERLLTPNFDSTPEVLLTGSNKRTQTRNEKEILSKNNLTLTHRKKVFSGSVNKRNTFTLRRTFILTNRKSRKRFLKLRRRNRKLAVDDSAKKPKLDNDKISLNLNRNISDSTDDVDSNIDTNIKLLADSNDSTNYESGYKAEKTQKPEEKAVSNAYDLVDCKVVNIAKLQSVASPLNPNVKITLTPDMKRITPTPDKNGILIVNPNMKSANKSECENVILSSKLSRNVEIIQKLDINPDTPLSADSKSNNNDDAKTSTNCNFNKPENDYNNSTNCVTDDDESEIDTNVMLSADSNDSTDYEICDEASTSFHCKKSLKPKEKAVSRAHDSVDCRVDNSAKLKIDETSLNSNITPKPDIKGELVANPNLTMKSTSKSECGDVILSSKLNQNVYSMQKPDIMPETPLSDNNKTNLKDDVKTSTKHNFNKTLKPANKPVVSVDNNLTDDEASASQNVKNFLNSEKKAISTTNRSADCKVDEIDALKMDEITSSGNHKITPKPETNTLLSSNFNDARKSSNRVRIAMLNCRETKKKRTNLNMKKSLIVTSRSASNTGSKLMTANRSADFKVDKTDPLNIAETLLSGKHNITPKPDMSTLLSSNMNNLSNSTNVKKINLDKKKTVIVDSNCASNTGLKFVIKLKPNSIIKLNRATKTISVADSNEANGNSEGILLEQNCNLKQKSNVDEILTANFTDNVIDVESTNTKCNKSPKTDVKTKISVDSNDGSKLDIDGDSDIRNILLKLRRNNLTVNPTSKTMLAVDGNTSKSKLNKEKISKDSNYNTSPEPQMNETLSADSNDSNDCEIVDEASTSHNCKKPFEPETNDYQSTRPNMKRQFSAVSINERKPTLHDEIKLLRREHNLRSNRDSINSKPKLDEKIMLLKSNCTISKTSSAVTNSSEKGNTMFSICLSNAEPKTMIKLSDDSTKASMSYLADVRKPNKTCDLKAKPSVDRNFATNSAISRKYKNREVWNKKDEALETYGLKESFLSKHNIKLPLTSTVVVQNLPPEADESKLREVFSLAGCVKHVFKLRAYKNLYKATIEFHHPVEAVQAVCMFHTSKLNNYLLIVTMMEKSTIDTVTPYPEGLTDVNPGLSVTGKPLKQIPALMALQPIKEKLVQMNLLTKVDTGEKNPFRYRYLSKKKIQRDSSGSNISSQNEKSSSNLNFESTKTALKRPIAKFDYPFRTPSSSKSSNVPSKTSPLVRSIPRSKSDIHPRPRSPVKIRPYSYITPQSDKSTPQNTANTNLDTPAATELIETSCPNINTDILDTINLSSQSPNSDVSMPNVSESIVYALELLDEPVPIEPLVESNQGNISTNETCSQIKASDEDQLLSQADSSSIENNVELNRAPSQAIESIQELNQASIVTEEPSLQTSQSIRDWSVDEYTVLPLAPTPQAVQSVQEPNPVCIEINETAKETTQLNASPEGNLLRNTCTFEEFTELTQKPSSEAMESLQQYRQESIETDEQSLQTSQPKASALEQFALTENWTLNELDEPSLQISLPKLQTGDRLVWMRDRTFDEFLMQKQMPLTQVTETLWRPNQANAETNESVLHTSQPKSSIEEAFFSSNDYEDQITGLTRASSSSFRDISSEKCFSDSSQNDSDLTYFVL